MERTLYECHGHIMMDGADFAAARTRHRDGADEAAVRAALSALREAGVEYFRDGGDALGVSLLARQLAPEYGVEYVTPAFAIHRRGYYGGIVGRAYGDLEEYRLRLTEARDAGCDFIKLILSGILTFRDDEPLSCPALPPDEIAALIAIAHGEGFAVMAHVNGAESVRAAIEAGADSIEHGYWMDAECLEKLAVSQTVWVPTLAAVAAFIGRDGFERAAVENVLRHQRENVRHALALGALVATGSDAGAFGVPHGEGAKREYSLLKESGAAAERLSRANRLLRERFRRKE